MSDNEGGAEMLGPVVVSKSDIDRMLDRLGREIEADMEGRSPVVIGVLGSIVV